MDFITKHPRTTRGVDLIWVIVDRLTKSANFIPIQDSISAKKLTEIYVREIVARHGVPNSVVSNRDFRITQILEAVSRQDGYSSSLQHHFPTSNGRTERK